MPRQTGFQERLKASYEEQVRALRETLASRERELVILSRVSARLAGAEDPQAILDIALEEILSQMDLQAGWIFLGDEQDGTLHLAASRGVAARYLDLVEREGLGECLCPEVFRSGHALQARNTTQCPRMPEILEGLGASETHACIPLHFEGNRRGVLNVAARPGEAFSDDELRFLETVGYQVSLAVERARHLETERRRNREARALAQVNRALGGSLDAEDVFRAVASTAAENLAASRVFILMGSEPRRMTVGYASGSPPAIAPGQTVDLEALGWHLSLIALRQRQLVRLDDRDRDDAVNREAARRLGIGAALVVPLIAHDRVLGVLVVGRTEGHRWSDDQLDLAESLATQASLALESARLYEDARRSFEAERLRNHEARAMAAINKAIGGSLDLRAVLKAVGETALEVVGADRVQILLGSDPRKLRVAHISGDPHPELHEEQRLDLLDVEATLLHRTIEEKRPFTIDDWTKDPRVNHALARRWDACSGIVIPLLARERTLGLVALTRRHPYHWKHEQVDVAEALAAQAAVALENARLYDEARRALQDLKSAQARIIQTEKMAVLGTFASGLAHEVRNPLNSIALQLSLLERRSSGLEGAVSGQMRNLTGIIREEVNRLERLVSDFLLFSRTSRIEYRPADLEALLDEVVRLLRPEARASGVTLKRQKRGERNPAVPMDAGKMKQVIINLVRNAIEAMPDGGFVVVEDGLVDRRARFTIRDNGPGLPEDLDVFQLFVTTKPKGTGLGLSIAQQIVLEHGGELEVDSKPGRGTSFIISLPLPPQGFEEAVRA